MKKFYKLLALAFAFGAPMVSYATVTTMNQLVGEFELYYMDGSFEEAKSFKGIAGENANELVFTNFYYIEGANLPVTVDFENRTVTFHTIENWMYMENYQGMANFNLYEYNTNHTRYSPVSQITASLLFDGTIQFNDRAVMEIFVPEGINPNPGGGGGFPGMGEDDGIGEDEPGETKPGPVQIVLFEGTKESPMVIKPNSRYFEYDPTEWTHGGLAQFTDMWIAPLLGYNISGGETLTYDVEYLVNLYDDNRFLLVDPYGANTIWVDESKVGADYVNTSATPGYIYINADIEEFVQIYPFVNSGYSSVALTSLSCTNEEGYRLWGGSTLSVVKSLLMSWGITSFSSRKGNTLSITNLIDWYDQKPYDYAPEYYVSTIVLKPGESGVNTIETVSNNDVRYFNLQGQEIIDPVKGQLVIKTQGNNAEKIIVR